MDAERRTFRVDAQRTPRLLFELSRLGQALGTETELVATFRSPAVELRLRETDLGRTLVAGDRSVSIGDGAAPVLEAAGLAPGATYMTESERYRVGGVLVSIDHVRPGGWLCVISEAPPADLDRVAEQLGLGAADAESRGLEELVRADSEPEATPSAAPAAVPAPPASLSGPILPASAWPSRTTRLVLIAAAGLTLAILLDPLLGVLAALVLLALEWTFGSSSVRTV